MRHTWRLLSILAVVAVSIAIAVPSPVLAKTPPVTETVTDTQVGAVTFDSAADGKRYTGRFNGVFNLQANRANAAFTESGTYHLRVQAADGSQLRFWITAHVTYAQHANQPTVEFFNVRCTAR